MFHGVSLGLAWGSGAGEKRALPVEVGCVCGRETF